MPTAATPSLKRTLPDSTSPSSLSPGQQNIDQARSLKRSRPHTSDDNSSLQASLQSVIDAGLTVSPLAKSPGLSPRLSPAPLTGAAALEDQRRLREEQQREQSRATSDNPGHRVLSSLISGDSSDMSKPQDAPTAVNTMNDAMYTVAKTLSIPNTPQFIEDKGENQSPASVMSLGSLNSNAATATASSAGLPSHNDWERRTDATPNTDPAANFEEKAAGRSLTFPGNNAARSENAREQARGMSLPMSGLSQQNQARSPQKINKCPHCDAQFTRQHNLKSHLLTHSQEKPFVCESCMMRFRRLHDLKRHSKLHTGERPHICPKCDRKFARGDALARHAKGQGGCAGRRASMGSFGGEDDYDESHIGDESGMDGVMFTEGDQQGSMEGDDRRFSMPSMKDSNNQQMNYGSQVRPSQTYPPPGMRRQPSQTNFQGELEHGNASLSAAAPSKSGRPPMPQTIGSAGQTFSPMQITESPKPVSPNLAAMQAGATDNSGINRQRSPSLATQLQQQNFGRRQSERIQSPQDIAQSASAPKLPSLTGLAPPEPRYTLSSQTAGPPQPTMNGAQTTHGQTSSAFQPQMTTAPQAQMGGSGSGDSASNLFASEKNLTVYVAELEAQVRQLTDRLESVEREKGEKIRLLQEKSLAMENLMKHQQQQIQAHQQQIQNQQQQLLQLQGRAQQQQAQQAQAQQQQQAQQAQQFAGHQQHQ